MQKTVLPVNLPAPLSLAQLEAVPGVLGTIARERYHDYCELELPEPTEIFSPASFAAAVTGNGLSLITEVKRSSPSQGKIADLNPLEAARAYQAGGANALSILTEPRHFGGELAHLRQVAQQVALPCLRKDFTVHPLQLIEAKAAGASAVLLIVAVMQEATADYLKLAKELGLDALVEVHDEQELDTALTSGATIIGVNNRDLRTLEIDLSTAPRLIRQAREQGFKGVLVAESGYRTADELRPLAGLADAVLIGTSIAGSGDLETAVRTLKAAL
jgi:indole-3-glycerol phosphate synthase